MKIIEDSLKQEVIDAIAEWQENHNSEDQIKKIVFDMLNKNRKEVMLKLMGFDNRHGRGWEIDHCNGRSGNSPIGDILKNKYKNILEEWLHNNLDQVLSTKISKGILNSCKADLRRDIEENLQDRVREISNIKTENYIEEILEDIEKTWTVLSKKKEA